MVQDLAARRSRQQEMVLRPASRDSTDWKIFKGRTEYPTAGSLEPVAVMKRFLSLKIRAVSIETKTVQDPQQQIVPINRN
jgi:hypothetical protein